MKNCKNTGCTICVSSHVTSWPQYPFTLGHPLQRSCSQGHPLQYSCSQGGHPLQRSTSTPSPSPCTTIDQQNQQFASKCREFELEIEKISSHVEHLKVFLQLALILRDRLNLENFQAQNAVLALSLEESKSTCDSLTELLGRLIPQNCHCQKTN